MAMESSDPIQSSEYYARFRDPIPPVISETGQKINSTLEEFVRAQYTLTERLEHLGDKVDNIRIENAGSNATLAAIKEAVDRSIGKLDGLDLKVNSKSEALEGKIADLKANMTALGVKANTNIFLQGGGILTLIFGLFTLYNYTNANRSSGFSSPTVTVPSPSPSPVKVLPAP